MSERTPRMASSASVICSSLNEISCALTSILGLRSAAFCCHSPMAWARLSLAGSPPPGRPTFTLKSL